MDFFVLDVSFTGVDNYIYNRFFGLSLQALFTCLEFMLEQVLSKVYIIENVDIHVGEALFLVITSAGTILMITSSENLSNG